MFASTSQSRYGFAFLQRMDERYLAAALRLGSPRLELEEKTIAFPRQSNMLLASEEKTRTPKPSWARLSGVSGATPKTGVTSS